MAGGRRKEPIDLLLLKGKANKTKAEIEKRKKEEINAPNNNIDPPDRLSEYAKEKFAWYINEMIGLGMIANLDVESLARYCEVQELYEKLMDKLKDMDVLDEEFGKTLRQQDVAFKQARSLANDLGFTVTSRMKIVVPKKEEKEETPEQKRFGNML